MHHSQIQQTRSLLLSCGIRIQSYERLFRSFTPILDSSIICQKECMKELKKKNKNVCCTLFSSKFLK